MAIDQDRRTRGKVAAGSTVNGQLRRPSDSRRGATMVEFALFFILFLMLTFGVLEFARALWTYTTLAHAARQGARYAMVHGRSNPVSDSDIRSFIVANAVGLADSSLEVNIAWLPDNRSGNTVEVEIRYPFRFVTTPLLLSNNSLEIASTSRMVIW
jgi:Flp pilus assembly protein TadG